MTTETTETKQLIRDLLASFTNHPEALDIEAQLAPGSAYWMIKGHPEDEPILVGRQGSHVRALAFLIQSFGQARDEQHTCRLLTEREPRPRPQMEARAVLRFDPEPSRALLSRILEELAIDSFAVLVGPGTEPRRSLTFVFSIQVKDAADYNVLTVAPDSSSETIVGALGTLFRAIAKKNGVRFVITVEKPS